ncbi:MAG TPA: DMT family transporter [Mycobacteriales bacterium]|jgi:drug/metabolite transporter (DMT)-like permease|nr:DMT family transporter [Mycobacteriales bacterium]
MTSSGAVGAALGGAAAAALSTVLQHRSAGQAPAGKGLRLGLLARLVRRPMWLAGLVAAGFGLALNAFALSRGGLAVVQPLLLTGLLFALPLSLALERRRPQLTEWGWAVLLVAGLAGFLIVARPSTGYVPSDTDALGTVIAAGGTAALGALALARRYPGHRAPLIGVAGGVAYGMTAALIKQVVELVGGLTAVPLRWPTYALVVVGATAIVLSQTAYQAGPIASSLPHLTMAELITGISLGVLVFHENLTHTPLAIAGEALCLLGVGVAVLQLARMQNTESQPVVVPAALPPLVAAGERGSAAP